MDSYVHCMGHIVRDGLYYANLVNFVYEVVRRYVLTIRKSLRVFI